MNLSDWSIRNPSVVIVLFFILTLGGLAAFQQMKVQYLPDLNIPMIIIACEMHGASPEQLEIEVVKKIENSIAVIQQVKHITSKIEENHAFITIEFKLEKPVEEAQNEVRSAIAKVRSSLPAELKEPVVSKLDLAGKPILAYAAISSSKNAEALSWFIDDNVSKKLLAVPGVGSVKRVGGVNREIVVNLNPIKLQSLGATVADISQQLHKIQSIESGGHTNLGSGEQPIRAIPTISSIDELKDLEVSLSDGRKIRLKQFADIKDTYSELRSQALIDGKPAIGFEITRSRGSSEVEVWKKIQPVLAEIQSNNKDLQITEVFNFVKPVEDEFIGAMSLLYEGAFLAIAVVWYFLREWKATIISAIALPLSVIPAFLGIYLLGFSLNMVTLLALSIVIGILVDDAIVEVENIMRHINNGKPFYQAAHDAASEIGLAVIATTLTIIAVFLPTAFMSGVAGQFFKQFGWTASIAVFFSLLVARMLTPTMAAYFLNIKQQNDDKKNASLSLYLNLVAWCLEHRLAALIYALLLFIGSLALIPYLPTGFMPADDSNQTQITIELPPGAGITQTIEVAEAARLAIAPIPFVKSIYAAIGSGQAGNDPLAQEQDQDVLNKARLTVLLSDRESRLWSKQTIEQKIREQLHNIPSIKTKVGLGGVGEKYILILTGEDRNELKVAAKNVEKDLRTIPNLGGISTSTTVNRPEINIHQDLGRAANLGVNTAAIAETLRIATVGDYDISLPKLIFAHRQLPVVVKLATESRKDLDLLERLIVPSNKIPFGGVMLSQVAKLELSSGPIMIDRFDRSQMITFEIEFSDQALGNVEQAIQSLPSIRNLPPDILIKSEGDAESMNEMFSSFGLAMITGIICIYLVLFLLFKDCFQPVSILAALPLAFGGSFIALLLAHKSFSLPTLIGLIMLMGVVCKNSILLVDYAVAREREHSYPRNQALLDACRKRARPVIMTTIAMAMGMLPIAMGFGQADPSFRSPMAIAVIGGLFTSTIFSLLLIPVVYTYVDDLRILLSNIANYKSRLRLNR